MLRLRLSVFCHLNIFSALQYKEKKKRIEQNSPPDVKLRVSKVLGVLSPLDRTVA